MSWDYCFAEIQNSAVLNNDSDFTCIVKVQAV